MLRKLAALSLLLGLASVGQEVRAQEEKGQTKIVLIAGRPSHGPGEHEFKRYSHAWLSVREETSQEPRNGVEAACVAIGVITLK